MSSREIGLSHLCVLDLEYNSIPLSISNISMSCNIDTESLKQLVSVDGKISCDNHMTWSTHLSSEEELTINISLNHAHSFGGLKIWNYNGRSDECYKGVGFLMYPMITFRST